MILSKMLQPYVTFPTWPFLSPRPRSSLDDYPFHTTEKLRFADTDRNGHVSNATFAVCCQNARMELLQDRARVPLPIDGLFVVARLTIEFFREMQWPGTVEIGTRLDRIGSSSVRMSQALFVADACVANAISTVVLIDQASRRPTALPSSTASALRTLLPASRGVARSRNGAALAAIDLAAKE